MRFKLDWISWTGLVAGLVPSIWLIVSGLERGDTLPILIGMAVFVTTMFALARRR